MKKVGILGAGWLGKALASFLSDRNFQVKISVRSLDKKEQLEKEGFETFVVTIDENLVHGDMHFFDALDVLIVSLPPVEPDFFKTVIKKIKEHHIKKIILFSSTGIYIDCSNLVDEETLLQTDLPKVHRLKTIEDLFLQEVLFNACILRLGGLIGEDRHPVTFLAKKKIIEDGDEPVNLIEREEILEIVIQLFSKGFSSSVFNAVSDDHRSKKIFYTEAAKERNILLPEFSNAEYPKKRIVSNTRLKDFLKQKS